jgi:hypothetical protein
VSLAPRRVGDQPGFSFGLGPHLFPLLSHQAG